VRRRIATAIACWVWATGCGIPEGIGPDPRVPGTPDTADPADPGSETRDDGAGDAAMTTDRETDPGQSQGEGVGREVPEVDPLHDGDPPADGSPPDLGPRTDLPDQDPMPDPGTGPAPWRSSVSREEIRALLQHCDRTALEDLLETRYDGPVCDDRGCTLITDPGPGAVSIRGSFNGWSETAMTPVPCAPGTFLAEVGPVPPGSDAWEYRIFHDGQWRDDPRNRYIRFSDLAINGAMYRPGVPRLARVQGLRSEALPLPRDVYVFVPAEAYEDPLRRFPVLLLQDGWNVFDNPRAPFGSWRVDRSARALIEAGAIEPVLLVGIATADRINEYLYTDLWVSGSGQSFQVKPRLPDYADLLIQVVLPAIRSGFPARTGPRNTAIGGSSLGGISAFWIAWHHPEVFGMVAALSPSFWVGEPGSGTEEKPSMRELIAAQPPTPAQRALQIYLDSGDGGYSPGGGDDPPYAWDGRAYTDWTRNLLIQLGWPNRPEWDTDGDPATAPEDLPLETDPDRVPALRWSATTPAGYRDLDAYLRPDLSLLSLLGVGHPHNEAAWEQRFPTALRFLFPGESP